MDAPLAFARPSVRLPCDMNISPATVEALRQAGWDALRVSDVLPANAPDDRILGFGAADDRVIVSQDLDFSSLLAVAGRAKPSLLSLRLMIVDPATVTARILAVLPLVLAELETGAVVVVEDSSYRVRRLPVS